MHILLVVHRKRYMSKLIKNLVARMQVHTLDLNLEQENQHVCVQLFLLKQYSFVSL